MAKEIWFRAKWYGYGWYPSTWQGWLVLLCWAVLFVFSMARLANKWVNSLFILVITAILILICVKKGEKPGWRWGRPKNFEKK